MNLPPRQKVLNYLGAYFDYIAANPRFPRVVQGEWIRTGSDRVGQMKRVAQSYFRPIYQKLGDVLRAGIESGEFRPIDPMHFVPSMVAVVVFYFSAVPVMKTLMKSGIYHGLATHDEAIINQAKTFATIENIPRNAFEFQMLHGIRRDLQQGLVKDGWRMRVYIPFGTEWYPYLMRRLAERPANALFIARNLLRK